ncbi:MAG: DUF177 domain-containing protein [Mesorhizobium sp.]
MPDKSPISYSIDIKRLPQKGFPVTVKPTEKELAALAAEHGLIAVGSFEAELLARDWKRTGVIVTGRVRAEIVQECVVTLEPISALIDQQIEATFVPEGSPLARPADPDGEMFFDLDGPDSPEVFEGDKIDVGALAEEIFALAIDPYPRKQGAELPSAGDGQQQSPFARLRDRLS